MSPSGPTAGCLNLSDPFCKDPTDGGGGPPGNTDGTILIAIDQKIRLERETFNATLGISARAALSNVRASIQIVDSTGKDASANFFVLVSSDPQGATQGASLPGSAKVSWQ